MNQFKAYTEEERQELNSNFIISSGSHSKAMCFARNPKDFERQYIYGERTRTSARTVAGQAYHYALDSYFSHYKDGNILSLPQLEAIAYEYVDQFPANGWKIQKTNLTVEACILTTETLITKFLNNFYQEKNKYEDDIKEILFVELFISEFITINGVDIPIPWNMKIDLVVLTKDDKVAIIDHKSKDRFTSDEEVAFKIGKQAITYTLGLEASYENLKVDEVWFAENKDSKNKDGSSQVIIHKIMLDENVRINYEMQLYEVVRAMINAIREPDYVYLLNESDNLADQAELIDFWYRTQISEIDDFNIDETKREMIAKRHKKIKDSSREMIQPQVIKNFKKATEKFIQYDLSTLYTTMKEKIEHTLRSFGLKMEVAHELAGYSSNTYLLEASAGVNLSSIFKHNLNIANILNVSNVRILPNLMVYEGKSYLAIETSKKREKDLIWDKKELVGMKIPIGKDNLGNTLVWDLENHSTPHVLVCGNTGSGKSVSLFSTIEYALTLKEIEKIIVLDPKMEFTKYSKSKKVSVYTEILEIEETMKNLVDEMNEKVKSGNSQKTLIIMDEFADAISASRKGKELDIFEMIEVGFYKPGKDMFGNPLPGQPKLKREKVGELKPLEENLRVLLQKGRSTGYRIISATQRASVKVISGDAKVNYPVRICFSVPTALDSKVVLDEIGAETLAGKGDFLMRSPEYANIVRGQAFYKP